MENTSATQVPTHVAIYKGNRRPCTADNYDEIVDEMIQQYGPGEIPQFEPINAAALGNVVHEEIEHHLQAVPTEGEEVFGEPTERGEGYVSLSGKMRSLGDEQTALEAGFAPAPPVYAVGTRVVQWGVDNARREQQEHDAKPLAKELCAAGVEQVLAEQRCDTLPLNTGDLRMDKTGRIVLPGVEREPGAGSRYPLTPRAFDSVFGRFACASGTAYLKSCPTRLRSINFNHWATETAETKGDSNQTVLRLRNGAAGREVFASVSPTYTAFDSDKILQALSQAFPEDARGSLDYTGEKLRVEGLWRTDVAPEEFVAGEFFKAGVIVRSDDTGGGSIRIQSVLWRNLCLNLVILDRAIGVDIRLNHTGSVDALARKFRAAFSKALGSVEPFRQAWGSAMAERDEKLVERAQGTTSEDISKLPATAVLPGLFNGILDRDLVPVKGRRKDVVPKLLEMHTQDEAADAYGVSRASVVNAFTRYAHQVETDPFAADEIRAGAGKLLSGRAGRKPAPLPYIPIAV